MVKVKKIVAIQDSGLIIDKLTWESQVYGGVIGGLNYGLFEERIMDTDHRHDAQPRHGVVQAGRRRRHPRDHRAGLRDPEMQKAAASSASASRRRSPPPPPSATPWPTPSASGCRNGRCPPATSSTPWPRHPKKGRREPMKAFEYAGPTTVDDAVKLLGAPDCRGPLGRHRPDRPDEGLRHQPRPRGLPQGHQGPRRDLRRPQGGGLTIGAGTRLADIVDHAGHPGVVPGALAGDRRGRLAPDPQHGDRRRQPAPAAALLVLPRRLRPARA